MKSQPNKQSLLETKCLSNEQIKAMYEETKKEIKMIKKTKKILKKYPLPNSFID